MRIIAVIPARGGSKGIPRKNLRLINGQPLISYAIRNALESRYITSVFVSTDSDEIAYEAEQCGAEVVRRDESISNDVTTLDPVIYDAVLKAEAAKRCTFDVVVTMQPTSPLLRLQTLDGAIESFLKDGSDTVISVVNKPHLAWGCQGKAIVPLYEQRKNRQLLPPHYLETGAFLICKRSIITSVSRIGENVSVYEVDEDESIDIDTKNDWVVSEALMQRKKIIFRADGNKKLGLGHIYNCITLAYRMTEHDILIVTHEDSHEGIAKLKESNLSYRVIKTEADIDQVIREFSPDIWVNDCLNTTKPYIRSLKKKICRVVSIEDLGSGATYADAVVNALYEEEHPLDHVYSGHRYVCLRDEFLLERPKAFSPEVKNVFIMFGGTDPSNLNRLVYNSLLSGNVDSRGIRFNFITGIGYDVSANGLCDHPECGIFIYPNVARVTKYMKEADLALIGQGRTIFEVASMGVPSVVLAQNERETTHGFASMEHGFLNLGLGKAVSQEVIENTLNWLIHTPEVRRSMHQLMLKSKLRSGIQRVKNLIVGDE